MHALECATGCTSWICNNWTAGLTADCICVSLHSKPHPRCTIWSKHSHWSIFEFLVHDFSQTSYMEHIALWTLSSLSLLFTLAWNYTLSRKKSLIIGAPGSGWDRNFYMGTQNGSNNKLWLRDFFDSHLRIKVTPLRMFPIHVCLYREALQCLQAWCVLLRSILKIGVWATCLYALYSSTVYLGVLCVGFQTIFFYFKLVDRAPLKKRKKERLINGYFLNIWFWHVWLFWWMILVLIDAGDSDFDT